MRLILVGCEYVGTTTLAGAISDWAVRAMGGSFGFHDHWKVPHVSHADHTKEENEAFLALSPNLRESFQRYHMEYHVSPGFYGDPHHNMVGFHIDEAVYAPLYYGYGGHDEYGDRARAARRVEAHIMEVARDTVLVHLKASPEAITKRMAADPHDFGLVKEKDVERVLQRFQEEYDRSFLRQKIELDNTDKTVDETVAEFVEQVQPHVTDSDRARMLTRTLPK